MKSKKILIVFASLVSLFLFVMLLSSLHADNSPTYIWDIYGRVSSINYGDVIYTYTYTPDGNVNKIYRNNVGLQFKYDSYGNIVREVTSVDGKSIPTSYSYNNNFYLTGIDNPSQTINYGYDTNENVVSERINGLETTWQYDSQNQPTQVIDPLGASENYAYNTEGMLNDIQLGGYDLGISYNDEGDVTQLCSNTEEQCVSSPEVYNDNGLLVSDGFYNYEYDSNYNLVKQTLITSPEMNIPEGQEYSIAYTYYSDGLVKTAHYLPLDETEEYFYDGLGRVAKTRYTYGSGSETQTPLTGNAIVNFFTGFVTKITGKAVDSPVQVTEDYYAVGGSFVDSDELDAILNNYTSNSNDNDCYASGSINDIYNASYADYKYNIDYDTCKPDNKTLVKYGCGFGLNLELIQMKKVKIYKDIRCPEYCLEGACVNTSEWISIMNQTYYGNFTIPTENITNVSLEELPEEPERPKTV